MKALKTLAAKLDTTRSTNRDKQKNVRFINFVKTGRKKSNP